MFSTVLEPMKPPISTNFLTCPLWNLPTSTYLNVFQPHFLAAIWAMAPCPERPEATNTSGWGWASQSRNVGPGQCWPLKIHKVVVWNRLPQQPFVVDHELSWIIMNYRYFYSQFLSSFGKSSSEFVRHSTCPFPRIPESEITPLGDDLPYPVTTHHFWWPHYTAMSQCPENVPWGTECPILFPASSLISSGKGQASKVSKATGGTFCPSGSVMTISLSKNPRQKRWWNVLDSTGFFRGIPLDGWEGMKKSWCLGLLECTKSGVLVSQKYLKAIQAFPTRALDWPSARVDPFYRHGKHWQWLHQLHLVLKILDMFLGQSCTPKVSKCTISVSIIMLTHMFWFKVPYTYTSIYCLTLSMESTSKCFCFKTHFGTCGKSSQRRISRCPAALAWSVPLPALVDGGVGCDSCVQTVWNLGARSTHLWGYSGHVVGMWWACGGHVVGMWWAYGGHVVGMWWACGGHVVGMWWACGGHVVGMWWACGGHVVGMWWACGGHVVGMWWACGGHVVGMWWACGGHVVGMWWACGGHVVGMWWACGGHVVGMWWACGGHVVGMWWACGGHVVGMWWACGGHVVGIWWACGGHVVGMWWACGGHVVGMWWACGGHVVGIWWARGGHVVGMWWACGGHVVGMWWACGGHVVGMWWACGGHIVGI